MKKYVFADKYQGMGGKCQRDEYYLAHEVEALLREIRDEIVSQSGLKDHYQDWSGAIEKIDSSLMDSANK